MAAGKPTLFTPLLLMALVVIVDQLTKQQVTNSFVLFESREVLPDFFNLTYLCNTGAAFGLLAGDHGWWRRTFFVLVAVAALGFISAAFRHFRHKEPIFVYSLGLIGGGALGNLIDRLRFGYVIDFLDFYIGGHHWPAFNVADSAICVGVGMFLLGSFLYRETEER